MNDTETQILERLRPRMRAARITHLRRFAAGVLLVPVLGVGAVAMAADGDAEPVIETTHSPDTGDGVPEFEAPDIGTASGAEKPVEVVLPPTTEAPEGEPEKEEDPEAPVVVELGVLGRAELEPVDAGLELRRADLVDGWEVMRAEMNDGVLVVVISDGQVVKIVKIRPGVRDEVDVEIVDLVLPGPEPEPEPEPEPKPEPEPEPDPDPDPDPDPVPVGRWVLEVPGKGSFVVEREGNTLYLGNITVNVGYDEIVHRDGGGKVHVTFTNGEWNWHAKAFIAENGEVQQHFWDEPVVVQPEPVYEQVVIEGVGSFTLKLWDGQIWVKDLVGIEPYHGHDHNGGEPGETAEVDFEGGGEIWIVDAWITEGGELAREITNEGGDA